MKPKLFIYFECEEGGMSDFLVRSEADLEQIYGWMTPHCMEDDRALVSFMRRAKVGELCHHRLGTLVRILGE